MKHLFSLSPFLATIVMSAASPYSQASTEEVTIYGTASTIHSMGTSQVDIIDAEDIARLQPRSTLALLNRISGVHSTQQGGAGGLSHIYLRGGESNFLAIMIDGVRVNTPTNTRGGSFDIASLPINAIERIEVIRGPQSAQFGSDALSGVINIVTKTVNADNQLRVEYGTGDQQHIAASVGGTVNQQLGGRVSIGHRSIDSLVEGDSDETTSVNAKGFIRLDKQRLDAALFHQDRKRRSFPEDSGGPTFAESRDTDHAQLDETAYSLRYTSQATRKLALSAYASRFQHRSDNSSPGIAPFMAVPANGSQDHYRRDIGGINAESQFSHTRLSATLEHSEEQGSSNGYIDVGVIMPTAFTLNRRASSAAISTRTEWQQGHSVSTSLRQDHYHNNNTELSPQVGIVVALHQQHSLNANWGQAYKQASFFALAHPLVGNPDLQPEQAESVDIGVTSDWSPRLTTQLNYFENRYRNLVDFDAASFKNVNRGRIETSGFELSLDVMPASNLQLTLNATYLDIDAQADTTLRGRPNVSASGNVSWHINPNNHLSITYQHRGDIQEASQHSGQNQFYTLGAANILNASYQWHIQTDVMAYLALDNAINDDYQDAVGFDNGGNQARLGIEWTL